MKNFSITKTAAVIAAILLTVPTIFGATVGADFIANQRRNPIQTNETATPTTGERVVGGTVGFATGLIGIKSTLGIKKVGDKGPAPQPESAPNITLLPNPEIKVGKNELDIILHHVAANPDSTGTVDMKEATKEYVAHSYARVSEFHNMLYSNKPTKIIQMPTQILPEDHEPLEKATN